MSELTFLPWYTIRNTETLGPYTLAPYVLNAHQPANPDIDNILNKYLQRRPVAAIMIS